jgi:hypothetical protein
MSEESNGLDVLGIKPIGESAKIITKGGVDGASALLSRICLPAAKEIGLLFADHVKAWRAEHAIKIANKAQALLEKQSENSVTAHPRIIYLTFEKGSLSEDDLVQDFWAGLLASSCTPDGKDESNLLFINILAQLTTNQVKLINYIGETATVFKATGGWIHADNLIIEANYLQEITGIHDLHQLDRELDHLRSLELIREGFHPESCSLADVTPSSLCLQLYVRSQGYVGSPIDYFGATEKSVEVELVSA